MNGKGMIFWLIALVVFLWIGCLLVSIGMFDKWEERGQFGDLFGAVNALFSGLAFVGLIYTIHLQGRELALQREELKLQREEMAKSREALTEQASIQARQFAAAVVGIKVSARLADMEALKLRFENSSDYLKAEVVEAASAKAAEISSYVAELEG